MLKYKKDINRIKNLTKTYAKNTRKFTQSYRWRIDGQK